MPALKTPNLKSAPTGLLLLFLGLFSINTLAATPEPEIPATAQLKDWYSNGHAGRYVLQMLHGRVPADATPLKGVVLSDSNCTPDANGLSHCHNRIELSNGHRITVINNHLMMRNRCLRAGDQLTLNRIDQNWVSGRLGQAE